MKLIPNSKARRTQAAARSRSTPTPKVSQDPREISETVRSLDPSWRYFMECLRGWGVDARPPRPADTRAPAAFAFPIGIDSRAEQFREGPPVGLGDGVAADVT